MKSSCAVLGPSINVALGKVCLANCKALCAGQTRSRLSRTIERRTLNQHRVIDNSSYNKSFSPRLIAGYGREIECGNPSRNVNLVSFCKPLASRLACSCRNGVGRKERWHLFQAGNMRSLPRDNPSTRSPIKLSRLLSKVQHASRYRSLYGAVANALMESLLPQTMAP